MSAIKMQELTLNLFYLWNPGSDLWEIYMGRSFEIKKGFSKSVQSENKSGIYKLQCFECNGVYIGQTGRSFETRYKEHISTFNNKHSNISHFAKHRIETGHTILANHPFDVIHTCDKGLKLNILKLLEIMKYDNNSVVLMNELRMSKENRASRTDD